MAVEQELLLQLRNEVKNHRLQGIEINDDGTKLFLLFYDETDANIQVDCMSITFQLLMI